MSTPYESDLDDLHEAPSLEREISLGAGTVLGIFLALAAVCGVFFAFGYTVGRRSNPKPLADVAAVSTSATGSGLGTGFGSSTPKPSPGSLANGSGSLGTPLPSSSGGSGSTNGAVAGPALTEDGSGARVQVPAPADRGAAATEDGATAPAVVKKPAPKPAVTAADGAVVGDPIPAAPKGAVVSPAAGGAPMMVQVAAVSHREDADLLLTALRQKGYDAVVRGGGQDSLMHIQVGPFASKKEAEAMRQRLLGDGFNAILK